MFFYISLPIKIAQTSGLLISSCTRTKIAILLIKKKIKFKLVEHINQAVLSLYQDFDNAHDIFLCIHYFFNK